MSKSPKQLPNCMVIAETSVVLIIFKGVLCEISTYIVTGSLHALHQVSEKLY